MRMFKRLHINVGAGIIALCVLLCASCGKEDAGIDTQASAFESYLTGAGLDYVLQNGVYRYISNSDRAGRDAEPEVNGGEALSFHYQVHLFSSSGTNGLGALIYTNREEIIDAYIEAAAQANLNISTIYWPREAMEMSMSDMMEGMKRGLPGSRQGDSLRLYITSDLAYGSTVLSGIPKNTPIVIDMNIEQITK
jgi:hypothetical protein